MYFSEAPNFNLRFNYLMATYINIKNDKTIKYRLQPSSPVELYKRFYIDLHPVDLQSISIYMYICYTKNQKYILYGMSPET